jgi:hypothetical protein
MTQAEDRRLLFPATPLARRALDDHFISALPSPDQTQINQEGEFLWPFPHHR